MYDFLLLEGATVPVALDYRVHVLFNDDFKLNLCVFVYDGVISEYWIGGEVEGSEGGIIWYAILDFALKDWGKTRDTSVTVTCSRP
jgi:hypothetical protein